MNFYSGILFGIYAFSIAYNLFLYLLTKDKSAKFLMWATVFFLIYSAISETPAHSKFENYSLIISNNYSAFLSLFFYVKFIFHFLQENETPFFTKKHQSINLMLLSTLYILPSIVVFITYFFETEMEMESAILTSALRIGDLTSLTQHIFFLVLFLRFKSFKYKGVRFILLGEVFLVTGILMSLLEVLFWGTDSYWTLFSALLFLILLSISVADKITHLKKQKEEAQEKALLHLEMKVQERTAEVVNQKTVIEKQKQLVEEKQKDIIDSILYAKRIQQSLLPTEKYIDKNIQRLKD